MAGGAAAATYKADRRGIGLTLPGNFAIPATNAYRPRFAGVSWREELDDGNLAAFIAEPVSVLRSTRERQSQNSGQLALQFDYRRTLRERSA